MLVSAYSHDLTGDYRMDALKLAWILDVKFQDTSVEETIRVIKRGQIAEIIVVVNTPVGHGG